MTAAARAVVALGLLLAVAACDRARASGGGGGGAGPGRAKVVTGELAPRVLLTGELKAANAIELMTPRTDSWEMTIRWMAEDGAEVKAGERVVELDNSAIASQLEQKKLLLRQAEATLRSTRDLSALATADKEAELRAKQAEHEKAKILAAVPADLLPGRTAQERQLAERRAASAVEAAQSELATQRKSAALDLRVKQIELDKARGTIEDAERALKELVITAPRDGAILVGDNPFEGRKFQVGDTAMPGFPIVTMPAPGADLQIRAELSDVDDGKIAAGTVGTCTLDAYPDAPAPCTVLAVTAVATAKNRESLRKAFDVKLSFEAKPGQAGRPGMSVKVELRPAPRTGVLLVPRGAVRVKDGVARVRLVGGATREVTLGGCDAQACAVDKGLAAGDEVEIGGAP